VNCIRQPEASQSRIRYQKVSAPDGTNAGPRPTDMRAIKAPTCWPGGRQASSSTRSRRGEIGPELFRKACEFGLEGLVSERRDRPHQAGRSNHWMKVKNRKQPAMSRVMDSFS
jgi:bifunctional non-homologous end joining protein LigD